MKFAVVLSIALCSQFALAATGLETNSSRIKTSTYENYPSSNPVSMVAPQIGYVSSNVVADEATTTSKNGLSVGATVDLGHSDIVLETGLLFRQEGATSERTTIELDYFVLPMLAKYYFNGMGDSAIYAKAGLVPGILLNARASADNASANIDDTNTLVLNGTIGLGGKIKINPSHDMILELVYSRGLTSSISDASVYNSLVGFNVGFGFEM